MLNRLTGSRLTAKVSKTPGRTRVMNFFDVLQGATPTGARLVDLPGYGYAKAGKAVQASWQQAVNEYLSFRDNLVGVVLVMDIRHPLQPYDTELINWADQSEMPMLVLLNKADKLKKSQRLNTRYQVIRSLGAQSHCEVQLFSAQTGIGSAETLAALQRWMTPIDPQ